jgi:hypothetical protein
VPRPWDGEPTPLKLALARAHRWLAMLESREVKSLREIARKDEVDSGYVSRMVKLTTLAPDIVAAILDDSLPPYLTPFELAVYPQAVWEEQRRPIGRRLPTKRWTDYCAIFPRGVYSSGQLHHSRALKVEPERTERG